VKSLDELIDEQLRLPPVLPEARRALAAIPGVVGVGLGFSSRGSQLTDEIALLVYVHSKRTLAQIPESEQIPRTFGGIPTDVLRCVSARNIQFESFDRRPLRKKASQLTGGLLITDREDIDENGDDGPAVGTLGCFARLKSDPSVRLLLTNQHVLYKDPNEKGKGPVVGQPDTSCSWCCKSGVIGETLDGAYDSDVDCAIARLNKKRPAVQKLPGVGKDVNGRNEDLITGVPQELVVCGGLHTAVLVGEPVRKVGTATGPTSGVVMAIDEPLLVHKDTIRMQNQILVRPERGGNIFGDNTVNFAEGGDSGSVLINRFNQVVGLLAKAHDFTKEPRNKPPWRMWGAACQIHRVMDKLGIEIITSPDANTRATPATPSVPAVTGALVPGTAIVTHEVTEEHRARTAVLDEIVTALESSPIGAEVLRLYDTHQPEIRWLVNHDRKVKVVWHRNRGPAFMAKLLGGMRDTSQRIPKQIDDVPIDFVIRRMAEALMERGSPALAAIARDYLAPVLNLVATSGTIADLLDRVHAGGVGR
jgi:hypothetical protein